MVTDYESLNLPVVTVKEAGAVDARVVSWLPEEVEVILRQPVDRRRVFRAAEEVHLQEHVSPVG